MNKKFAIDHVNNHHLEALIIIFKRYINSEYKVVKLHDYDLEHITLLVDNKKTKIPFPKKLKNLSEFKDVFIEMYKNSKIGFDEKSIIKKIKEFMKEYNSVILSTIFNKKPVLSYAFLLTHNKKFYIYISSVAKHYHAIKQNPNHIKVMWLEDESKAASPISRKRLIFDSKAKFVENEKEVKNVFNSYIKKYGSHGGIAIIQNMEDFFLIELKLEEGRYVHGFGQAYKVKKNWKIEFLNTHQIHKN